MNIPDHFLYTTEHEWLEFSGDKVRLGITEYAQEQLGDIVFTGLPEVGKVFGAGEILVEIESTKSVGEIYAPTSGTVTSVNGNILEHPDLLNSDPYGEGWLLEVTFSDETAPRFLTPEEYAALIA